MWIIQSTLLFVNQKNEYFKSYEKCEKMSDYNWPSQNFWLKKSAKRCKVENKF